jgi:hypothetical protein
VGGKDRYGVGNRDVIDVARYPLYCLPHVVCAKYAMFLPNRSVAEGWLREGCGFDFR